MEPDEGRHQRRPTPENAAIWILGIVLLALVAFVLAIILLA